MPASASVSAISATGSAYTPFPQVHRRSSSMRWTNFSTPAQGSCTQPTIRRALRAAAEAVGVGRAPHTSPSASPAERPGGPLRR